MRTIGIIAEYNPFHNGHAYQIHTIKEKMNADYVIVAMSGNFVQRGEPALTDKYTRAKMALQSGADLVFELPGIWSTSSAEYFSRAGVSLFANTGITDGLCFGSETDDLDTLQKIADFLVNEPQEYKKLLLHYQKEGLTFPQARARALNAFFPESSTDLLSGANTILAVEYLKSLLETSIKPYVIKRQGDDYRCPIISSAFASATALRRQVAVGNFFELSHFIPADAFATFLDKLESNSFLLPDCLDLPLGYELLKHSKDGYLQYADCSKEISDRIRNNLREYNGFLSFCEQLKTKEITYSRIQRVLLHIVLGITKEDYQKGKELGFVPYLRILGFRKEASLLLKKLQSNASVPIISKVADARTQLTSDALELFQKDIWLSDFYNQQLLLNNKIKQPDDYRHSIVIL